MPYTYNPLLDAGLDQTGAGGGGTPGGSNTQLQFNDSGSFGGDADLTYNKTTNALTIGGDVTLNDGGSFTTTLQTITPTANRTVSLPDATGTVALVAGSSGQLLWNNAGANAGASTLTYDGSILTSSGRFINSYNATASSPAKAFTGTWFTGGTATTTKPQVLIEPTGTTSTAWSTSGTGFGVNAASGFAGNLLDLQVNGTSQLRVSSGGILSGPTGGTFTINSASGQNISISAGAGGNILVGTTIGVTGGSILGRNSQFSIYAPQGAQIGWGSSNDNTGTNDTVLFRDAAGTLAQRNGTNAQTFRVYNTFTDASNYERAELFWNNNTAGIALTNAGTGAARSTFRILGGNTGELQVAAATNSNATVSFNHSATTGSGGANTGFVGRISSHFGFFDASGSVRLAIPSGASDRWAFFGTTSSFPALKQSGAVLQARLADDSGYTTLDAQHRLQGTAPASATAAGTAGDIRYDADYIYVCTATNTWKRAALATW